MSVTPIFWHEKLDVYRQTLAFASRTATLITCDTTPVAAIDHLNRATESILENLANGNATWSSDLKKRSFAIACGSGLECAACLDVCCARQVLPAATVLQEKQELRRIVQMLVGLVRSLEREIREEETVWSATDSKECVILFDHERLDVYHVGLEFVHWVDGAFQNHAAARKRLACLDSLSTSIVLNIAEGNGRFSSLDHRQFADIAHRAALKSAVMLDLMVAHKELPEAQCNQGKEMLGRIVKMLLALHGYLEQEAMERNRR